MKPDKRLLGKYAVIRMYTGANPNLSEIPPASFVKFDKTDPNIVKWRSGSWCTIGKDDILVEVFAVQPKKPVEVDKLYVEFINKYHPVKPTEKEIIDSWELAYAQYQNKVNKKIESKNVILEKLGLSAEEVRLLLS
jgi:hypothetical protein